MAYRNIRYEGVGGGRPSENSEIVKLSTLPFETIDSYDRPFFPANRSKFIKSWINQADCHALGIQQNGKLTGYGIIRSCRSGYKIGPLFADSPELDDRDLVANHTNSSGILVSRYQFEYKEGVLILIMDIIWLNLFGFYGFEKEV